MTFTFSDLIINDINHIADWLSVDDFSSQTQIEADLLILAGHAILPNIFGALTLATKINIPILFSGGVGHSTELLRQAIQTHPLSQDIDIKGTSEAEMLAELAISKFSISSNKIMLENKSRNCGENAAFSRDLLISHNLDLKQIILIQDPLMQRRTTESFIFNWHNQSTQFISWPVFKPQLVLVNKSPVILGSDTDNSWGIERFIAMILGEVKRLKDTKDGYGPLGSGFIHHVDIPDSVDEAAQRLMGYSEFSGLVR